MPNEKKKNEREFSLKLFSREIHGRRKRKSELRGREDGVESVGEVSFWILLTLVLMAVRKSIIFFLHLVFLRGELAESEIRTFSVTENWFCTSLFHSHTSKLTLKEQVLLTPVKFVKTMLNFL